MTKKDITQERIVYKPFEYPTAFDYWLKQQQAHWIHTEVPMMSDINDWKQNLNETEKNIIGSILKGFAQTETVVNDYWTGLVTKWFRKPEIIAMATVFGAMETIHAEAYSLLNEELGLDDFSEFLEDETTMAKIEALTENAASFGDEVDWHERAKSLAIFSAFTEGVNLFSSFAVLSSGVLREGFSSIRVLNNQHPASECIDSSLIDHSTICPTPFNLFLNLNDNKIAKELKRFTPSVKAENIANDFARSCQSTSSLKLSLTFIKVSILAIVVSSSKNSLKSSNPNSSFNKL